MKEIILDTETTGLSVQDGHRIVEIGCIELDNLIPTRNKFHCYLNPQRKVSERALQVHGYTDQFLSDKKKFSEIVNDFLSFIKDKKIIIHNAEFDLAHINNELSILGMKKVETKNILDTLELAREKFPGSQNSLDALCKRFNIDSSRREKHSALVDCQLLKEIYINLLDQKEPKLKLETRDISNIKLNSKLDEVENIQRKLIKISKEELELHKKFLKTSLQRNFFK